MPSLDRDDVERALRNKGFVEERSKHHRYFKLTVDGKYTGICTKTSHGTGYKTLGSGLVNSMAKQLHLTTAEFSAFVCCTLSGSDYVTLVDARVGL